MHRDGKEVQASDKIKIQSEAAQRSLVIVAASIEDVGEYTCVAENVRTTTELEVKGGEEKIELEAHDKDQVGIKGQDVTFKVTFKQMSGSKPEAKWSYNGKELSASEKVCSKQDGFPSLPSAVFFLVSLLELLKS